MKRWHGVLLLWAAFASTASGDESHSAQAVKAAYLYRFATYVSWPEAPAAERPFLIDVVGDPGVAGELRHLLPGHQINKQSVVVREVASTQELGAPQMLYVGAGHTDFLRAVAAGSATNSSMLIVSDDEQALALGSALNFVAVDKRIRFEVSLTAAERAGLKISADLLSVAIRVHGGRRQSGGACIPFPLMDEREGDCAIRQVRQEHGWQRGEHLPRQRSTLLAIVAAR